jgi:hypothetical protein
MKAAEAREFGAHLASLVETGNLTEAGSFLAPLLAERIPFTALGRIGEILGRTSRKSVNALLDEIAAGESEGGWVIIGCALGQLWDGDPEGTYRRCKRFVIRGDVWYAADILAERVPGPALVVDFSTALKLLEPWRNDDNRWVRRAAGVAVHFWAKRSKGAHELRPRAKELLGFLEPMFSEWEIDAAKGVGWGLKTMGKHYPDLLAAWLPGQLGRRHRALMLRKAPR